VFAFECSVKQYSSLLAFHTGFIPAFFKLYTTLFVGIKISDIAFRNIHLEGELWEPATVFAPTRPGYIPHEYSKEELKRVSYEAEYLQPNNKVSLGPGTNSYIKF